MTPTHLATALCAHAQGIYCLEAAAELLIAQFWLQRADVSGRFINISPTDGHAPAIVNWAAAITALDAGELSCSGGE
jgi:hypothetical protein